MKYISLFFLFYFFSCSLEHKIIRHLDDYSIITKGQEIKSYGYTFGGSDGRYLVGTTLMIDTIWKGNITPIKINVETYKIKKNSPIFIPINDSLLITPTTEIASLKFNYYQSFYSFLRKSDLKNVTKYNSILLKDTSNIGKTPTTSCLLFVKSIINQRDSVSYNIDNLITIPINHSKINKIEKQLKKRMKNN